MRRVVWGATSVPPHPPTDANQGTEVSSTGWPPTTASAVGRQAPSRPAASTPAVRRRSGSWSAPGGRWGDGGSPGLRHVGTSVPAVGVQADHATGGVG
ncbi:MAG: hypothetical protein JWO74_1251 [Solirubrobacterales bacterium]|nr:hypothetical protein [Solirubrobacterales bacterium]